MSLRTGPGYLACDGCDRTLWHGEGLDLLVAGVHRLHICSEECALPAIRKHVEGLPKTAAEAASAQVENAAEAARVKAAKDDHHARRERLDAEKQARAAAVLHTLRQRGTPERPAE